MWATLQDMVAAIPDLTARIDHITGQPMHLQVLRAPRSPLRPTHTHTHTHTHTQQGTTTSNIGVCVCVCACVSTHTIMHQDILPCARISASSFLSLDLDLIDIQFGLDLGLYEA